MNSDGPICADLFAGAGGLSAGFRQAGFRSLFFNEVDEAASATFRLNFPEAVPFVCPIQELTTARIEAACPGAADGIDVMMGGPPCQGFSINAPERSRADPRNHLFRHYVRLVLEGLRPKFVVMENVPGLLSLDRGSTLRDVLAAFGQSGYRTAHKILNAAHYGVPQERWRLVILGTRLPGVVPALPRPSHYSTKRTNFAGGRSCTFGHAVGMPQEASLPASREPLKPPRTVGEAISDLPAIPPGGIETSYASPPQNGYQGRLRDSERLFNHQCARLAAVNLRRIAHVRPGGSWRDIPHSLLPKGMQRARKSDHTRRYGRLHPDEASGTILTKCDPHWGTFIHYAQDRIISVREAARIQSFPDSFRFLGSKTEAYRQVGNAVPPLLAHAIACRILELMRAAGQGQEASPLEEGANSGGRRLVF